MRHHQERLGETAMRKRILSCLLLLGAGLFGVSAVRAEPQRIQALASIKGTRPLHVEGHGLVTGLKGTGDQTPAARNALRQMLSAQNILVSDEDIEGKNVALVLVTAEIPAFLRPGSTVDVRVSSTNAKSLENGVLSTTMLRLSTNAPVYAVAFGRVLIGGEGAGNRFETTGSIPGGAQVVRSQEVDYLSERDTFELILGRPSFTDAANIAKVINTSDRLNPDLEAFLNRQGFGALEMSIPGPAQALDADTVIVQIPEEYRQRKVQYVGSVLQTPVEVDVPPRVVINRATNTVIITGEVKVSRAAIAHGNLSVLVEQPPPQDGVPQPKRFLEEPQETRTVVEMSETLGQAEQLQTLLKTLNAMKTTPRDVITIIENLHRAGALHAELIVQ
ncbi:MAG: flagellar basal body P-ring protein FlgI [Planctomycetota bacterium]